MLKLLFVCILLFQVPISKTSFYTGHASYWVDYPHHIPPRPISVIWTEAADSTWLKMIVLYTDTAKGSDTMEFTHERYNHQFKDRQFKNHLTSKWKFTWENNVLRKSYAPTEVIQYDDSIQVSIGFGFSGTAFYLRKK